MSRKQVVVLSASICGTLVLTGGAFTYKNFFNAPVLSGAGDIAIRPGTGDEATAGLLDDNANATVFTTGDNVYDKATDADFKNCYEPSWGRHKARTKPSVGNH